MHAQECQFAQQEPAFFKEVGLNFFTRGGKMKIDIGVPNSMHVRAMVQPWEYALTGEDVCNAVALADRLGFYKCMLGEHFIVPNQHLDLSGAHYFHTAVALGVFGGCTKKLRL